MTDELEPKLSTIEIQPVQAVIIGTGDGTVKQVIETPAGQPDLIVTYIGPVLAILVRFVNTFLTILVGLVSAGMTTNIIPAHDFVELVWKCAQLSVAGAGFGLLKDLVTVFGKLEQKFPLLRA